MRCARRRWIVVDMTSHLRRAALVPIAAALCAPATGGAVPLHVDATASAREQWTYKDPGYPQACPGWTWAKGRVSAVAHATGPLIFASAGGISGGGLSQDATQTLEAGRDIDYRVHAAGTQPPCVPCGPDSEYGLCGPPPPRDTADHSGCHPEAREQVGLIGLTFTQTGTLIVTAQTPVEAILRDCTSSQLLLPEIPLGSPGFTFKTIKFPGAARQVRNLAAGRSVPFRKSWRSGSGCPARRAKMQACTTYTINLKVSKTKD
jgi:hypothetical protein